MNDAAMQSDVDSWIKLITQVGFPILVAAYLLMRLENTIKDLTKTVNRLVLVLAKHGIDIEEQP